MTLPNSTIQILNGQMGAGAAVSADLLLVAGNCSAGPLLTPRRFSSISALTTAHGFGPAVEAACHEMKTSGKSVLFARLPNSTAGTNSEIDSISIDATTTIVTTLTGAPYDDYDGVFEVLTGGTRGTAGIEFRVSLDGGITWELQRVALGTATTYAIPDTGLTLNFAAGIFVAGDTLYWRSVAPRWVVGDLADLFVALKAQTNLVAAMLLTGDVAASEIDDIDGEVASYATDKNRLNFVFCNTRRARLPRRAQIGAATLTFAEANPDTITRSAGSWLTSLYAIGDQFLVENSLLNDGTYTIANVTSTVITLDAGDDLTAEVATADVKVTAVEPEETWLAALDTEFASTSSDRISLSRGHTRIVSAAYKHRAMRRPASWAAAARFMRYDLSTSLAEVERGALPDCTLVDTHGNITDHDENVTEGGGRFLALRQFDARQGCYIVLPNILAANGSDFTRIHYRAVTDLGCSITRFTLEGKLSKKLLLDKKTGKTIDDAAATSIERAVNRRLRTELEKAGHVTSAVYTIQRDSDLSLASPKLTGTLDIVPLFYPESIETTVRLTQTITVPIGA